MPSSVSYTFSLTCANQNFLDLSVTMPVKGNELIIKIPAWRPGRYELGNFSRNIRKILVEDTEGRVLKVRKHERNSWKIEGISGKQIKISYQYFSNELNAGSTFTDGTFLYVNPVNCAIYAEETMNLSCTVILDIPIEWQVAGAQSENNQFVCNDFDKLVDTPFIASPDLLSKSYKIGETQFTIWMHRQLNIPWRKLLDDFTKFSAKLIEEFGDCPTKKFEFIILSLPNQAYHGVEHLESTIITLGPSYDVFGALYPELLGVSCHELYHVWNVKTIRPKELHPYDLSKENYSQLGFIYEGITTYFGDLQLLKSGVFSINQYLTELSDQFQKHADNFGRRNYSLADSSIDTWVDGYVPGVPERKISIYTEGCLFAFWLDNKILSLTENTKSLQTVMSALYQNFGKKNKGIDLAIFSQTIQEITQLDLSDQVDHFLFNTIDYIDELQSSLKEIGLGIIIKEGDPVEKILGIKVTPGDIGFLVISVHPEGTAAKNGLRRGDEIIAVNGIKVKGDLKNWISYFENQYFSISILRNGILLDNSIHEFSKKGFEKYTVSILPNITTDQKNKFFSWSGISLEKALK